MLSRALQWPKEYPELADSCHSLPDSSNRLTSPAPSSGAPSPVARVTRTSAEAATQTEAVTHAEVGVQVQVESSTTTDTAGVKTEAADTVEKRRGCPKGGWPGRKKKKLEMLQAAKERKSSRIEQKDLKSESDQDIIPKQFALETDTPLHLQRPESERWTEGCEYFCMLCSQTFTAFGIYKHHIGNDHGLLMEDYRAKFGRSGEIIKKYGCKVPGCGQDMIHKNTTIRTHMKTAHTLSLADYHAQYMQGDTEAKVAEAKAEVKAPPLPAPRAGAGAWYNCGEAGRSYSCRICGGSVEWSEAAILNHLDSEHQVQKYFCFTLGQKISKVCKKYFMYNITVHAGRLLQQVRDRLHQQQQPEPGGGGGGQNLHRPEL